ncbi:MAG: SLC13 family permease [Bdellovibrionota bacterium]
MTVNLSPTKFLLGCCGAAILILVYGSFAQISPSLVAIEVFATILGLFLLGSFKYRLDKNALTYGMGIVIFATFWPIWWPTSALKQSLAQEGTGALLSFFGRHFLTLHGLDHLFHADTMLFILGLTLFVCVIAQTRLLEEICFAVLNKMKGNVVPTIAILTGIVSFASGILDGVSMIGLTIRILVMILFMSRAKDDAVIYVVMVSTVVTTVCGMWLAYGEPPNLIMKANLHPHLDDAFFLRYCAPAALASYFVVAFNLRKKLKGRKVDTENMDILDAHAADVRFLQAARHGEVLIPTEFVDHHKEELGEHYDAIEKGLHRGEPLGLTLVKEKIPQTLRRKLLGLYLSDNLAEELDTHYEHAARGDKGTGDEWAAKVKRTFRSMHKDKVRAQRIGALAFIPFIGFLAWHALNHEVPLFLASFAGFAVAFTGIVLLPKTRSLALHEAKHEYMEYLFLIPLFFSISLLQKVGFFDRISDLLHHGINAWGPSHVAYVQYMGATVLSAILDNNVVADFASHALHDLELSILHLFAMAQIAGYAVGGCWTHIGCAQSVVAYAFIQREVDSGYTPVQWIKAMTPVILEICVLMIVIIYGEGMLLEFLH